MTTTSTYETQAGGYDVILEYPEDGTRLLCVLCSKIMRDPVQTIRGEIACEKCYNDALGTNVCPMDQEPIEPKQIFKDNFKAREIKNLSCLCFYQKNGCTWIGKLQEVEDHQSNCKYQPGRCPLCDNVLIDITQENHILECKELPVEGSCFYAKYGCPSKFNNKDDHLTHLKEDVFIHLTMVNKNIESIKKENETLYHELEKMKTSTKQESEKMTKEVANLNGIVTTLSETLGNLQTRMKDLTDKFGHGAAKEESSSDGADVAALATRVSGMDKNVIEVDLKQELFENTTYTGRILWKIDNLRQKTEQASIGRAVALHSAPCFTEKYGYRCCARLYLNGHGIGKCTHVSLFIVIMKSEYDNLLTWPFSKRVSFRLINLEDDSKSVYESFLPDRFSSSFQKPTKDFNEADGCPMFMSKDELHYKGGFIKDDSIFIEINIS